MTPVILSVVKNLGGIEAKILRYAQNDEYSDFDWNFTAMKKILIIDDDVKLVELLRDYLSQNNYEVIAKHHPQEGLIALERQKPDLLILDIMLPDKDGFELCREIRKTNPLPIIMLSARGEVTDRIVGLELGADDYLPKPFEPRELIVRIGAILRRAASSDFGKIIVYGQLKMDRIKRSAFLYDEELELSTAEFDILELFVTHPGRTFNRDQIIDLLKGSDWATFDRSIDVLVSRLRQKLNDNAKSPKYIKTIWGTGYRFIGHKSNEST